MTTSEHSYGPRLRWRPDRRLPIQGQSALPSPDKAWLLGFLAGDGNIQIDPDGGAKVSANCGQDEQLARHVVDLFEQIYDVPCKLRLQQRDSYPNRDPYWHPIAYRRAVADDLLLLAPFGIYRWRVPEVVANGPDAIKAAWLSGIADAEGSVAFYVDGKKRANRNVSITSSNGDGLRQAQGLLAALGIRSAFSAHERETSTEHKIHVCYRADLEKFAEVVGFRCERKAAVLQAALGSYVRPYPNLRSEDVEKLLPAVLVYRAQGLGYVEIAELLQLPTMNVARNVLKRAKRKFPGLCLSCRQAKAELPVPRVIRGRQTSYVCEPCLKILELAAETNEFPRG